MSTPPRDDPRATGIWRLATVVYWFVVVEVAFLLAAAPGLAGVVFLIPDPSNLPLYALCSVPVVLAFSAALSTMRARLADDDPVVWPRFWRSWLGNLGDVLKVWLPALAVLVLLGYNLLFGPALGVEPILLVVSAVLAVVVTLWAGNAVVIASLFRFRGRDTARLAAYYLLARPLVALGAGGLYLLAGVVWYFGSPWLVALLASLFAASAVVTARPMLADLERRFTAPPPDPAGDGPAGP